MLSLVISGEQRTLRVFLADCTAHPSAAGVTQQVRQLNWAIQDGDLPVTVLLHDRDAKFPPSFYAGFKNEDLEVALSPPRSPWANGVAERWIRPMRRECLDQLLILNERHLLRVLTEYVTFYKERRPHQGLGRASPVPRASSSGDGPIELGMYWATSFTTITELLPERSVFGQYTLHMPSISRMASRSTG